MEIAGAAGRTARRRCNGIEAAKPPFYRGKPGTVVEPKIRTGGVDGRLVAKWQAGNFDPGMDAPERGQPLRASERPLRATGPGRVQQAACLKASIRRVAKLPVGELTGEALRALDSQCSVPCMPVASQAGNQVTWNLFLFGAAPPEVVPYGGAALFRDEIQRNRDGLSLRKRFRS